jgi:DNA-binding transcriptional LysR family regulator
MELNNLKAFITVADCNSFSIAGEQLHLTQPAISKRIAALEQTFSARLFDRIGRKIYLTESGTALLPVARNICNELTRIQHTINSIGLGDAIGGTLCMGTSHHLGLHRLPSVLRRFTTNHPQVNMELHFMDSEEACTKLESNALEIAVITLPEHTFSNLKFELIWSDPLVIATELDHPLTKMKNPTVKDLANFPAIVPSVNTVTREVLDKALLPYNVRLKAAIETNYIETIKTMVSVGLGWGAIPKTLLSEDLAVITIPELDIHRRLGIAYHKDRSLSAAAQAFIRLAKETSDKAIS